MNPFSDLDSQITGFVHSNPTLKSDYKLKPIIKSPEPLGFTEIFSLGEIHVDQHGILTTADVKIQDNLTKEQDRHSKWALMVHSKLKKGRDSLHIMPEFKFDFDLKFEERIWKGIPRNWRGHAWADIVTQFSGFYAALSKEQVRWLNMELLKKYRDLQIATSSYESAIMGASKNILPRHVYFQKSSSIESLIRILRALSLYNCEVGFVYGMHMWVGMLLTLYDEETAFFLAQKLFYHGSTPDSSSFYKIKRLYLKNDAFMDENIFIHRKIMEAWYPQIFERMESFEIKTEMYLKFWYHSMFVGCSSANRPFSKSSQLWPGLLPWSVVLRIWDIFIYYGWDIMPIVSISILQYYRDQILQMDPATLAFFLGIEQGKAIEDQLGIPVDGLPTITNEDKFMNLIQRHFVKGKKRILSFLSDSSTSGRSSVDSISSPTDEQQPSDLSRLSGKDIVHVLRFRFHC
jgi:hypothetical protein